MGSISVFDMPFEYLPEKSALDWVTLIGVSGCGSWFVIYALIVIHRGWILRQERIRNTIHSKWEPLLLAAAFDTATSLPDLQRHEWIHFFEIWQKILMTLKGDAQERLIRMARDIGLYRYARRELRFGQGMTRRKKAITIIGWVGTTQDWMLITRYLDAKDNAISFAAARALTRLNQNKAIPLVISAVANGVNWPSNLIAAILLEAGGDRVTEAIMRHIVEERVEQWQRLAPYFRYGSQKLVARALESTQLMERAPSDYATILEQCREPSALTSLRTLLHHPSPAIRLAVIRALRMLAESRDIPALRQALSDPVWQVRYAAAHALRDLIRPEPEGLEQEKSFVGSKEAEAVLQHVMAEAWL